MQLSRNIAWIRNTVEGRSSRHSSPGHVTTWLLHPVRILLSTVTVCLLGHDQTYLGLGVCSSLARMHTRSTLLTPVSDSILQTSTCPNPRGVTCVPWSRERPERPSVRTLTSEKVEPPSVLLGVQLQYFFCIFQSPRNSFDCRPRFPN